MMGLFKLEFEFEKQTLKAAVPKIVYTADLCRGATKSAV